MTTNVHTVIHDTLYVLACRNQQMRIKMRHYVRVSKSCVFVFCNESLFTTDFRTLYRERKCSIGRAWYSTHTNQVVKGMQQF